MLALPHGPVLSAPGISVVAEGSSERWIVDLGGVLVAALAPELAGWRTRAPAARASAAQAGRAPTPAAAAARARTASRPARRGARAAGSTPWRRSSSSAGAGAGAGRRRTRRLTRPLRLLSGPALAGAGRRASASRSRGFDLRSVRNRGRCAEAWTAGSPLVEPGRLRFWEAAGAWSPEVPPCRWRSCVRR